MYNYESTGVTINFPNNSHGIIFAFIELAGSLFAFVQIPITEQVKGKDSLMLKYQDLIYRYNDWLCPIIGSLPLHPLQNGTKLQYLMYVHMQFRTRGQ